MKSILLGIFLGLVSLQLISAQGATCTGLYTTCKSCTSDPNCGWCSAIGTCFNGTAENPAGNQKCYGDAWFFGPRSCPTCSHHQDCKSCLTWVSDCGWCTNTQTCGEWGPDTLGCGATRLCPCNTYDDCTECNSKPQCTWCGGSNNTCINDIDAATCPMPMHTCPCSLNKDCHSCREDTERGCQWCETGGTAGGGSCVDSVNAAGCPVPLTCNTYCQQAGATCNQCNNLNGCVWCGDSNTCVDAMYATCMIRHTCPNCGIHRYCDPCLDEGNGNDCVWCGNGECRDALAAGDCLIAHTCQSYCSAITSCGQCNAVPGCGWCEASKSCVDADASSCLLVHSCQDESCGFDGGAFVGGMFLGIGLVAIGIGAYLFYRWKTGKRAAYSELR